MSESYTILRKFCLKYKSVYSSFLKRIAHNLTKGLKLSASLGNILTARMQYVLIVAARTAQSTLRIQKGYQALPKVEN
jgi:hypothetical protein